MLNQDFFKW